jgi:alkanesulfonate monooxygenase SsuD/methylene tetrahydromethanopterin reductase-like flavin-dependent oxidoreductase (luciferase family)
MYGIPFGTIGSRIRAMGEACEVLKRLWTEELATYEGRFYTLREARCEPKPIQNPHPPITIGGTGERLTLRIVAQHADRWNFNGKSVEEFVRLNHVLDEHCAAVGRDPRAIQRSVQRHLSGDLAAAADEVRTYVDAGAEHIVLNPRVPLTPGIATRVAREIVEPVLASR